jgi:hypothetical protein
VPSSVSVREKREGSYLCGFIAAPFSAAGLRSRAFLWCKGWALLAHRRRGEAEGSNGKKNADLRGTLRPFRTTVARRTFAGRFRAASISVLKRHIELRHQGDKQHGSILQ